MLIAEKVGRPLLVTSRYGVRVSGDLILEPTDGGYEWVQRHLFHKPTKELHRFFVPNIEPGQLVGQYVTVDSYKRLEV